MATITIGSNDYFSYQTVAEVAEYAAAALGAEADAWAAASAENQAKAAVSATRILDRQAWAGSKTDEAQDGAFPRTGLTYRDGTEVDSTTVPVEVLSAHSELSMALLVDATAGTTATVEVRRQKAGSVEIEYFRSDQSTQPAPLPSSVLDYISLWLGGGASSVSGSEATGYCEESAFDERAGLSGSY